ncbi:glycosyltransferase family 2 protein [Rivularia sp. UHCC 0363]|uniref:glycosyltransferase family 2 protein n=1 Tax=Rivularia sp. UHCC 0363 TaxID=3110244 RepID=UPI002B217024|nr:glycosyltransferase family 2 protein [Rivularia sp. UHCC 0363]MEA5598637.1 glycosyltransferase family 2 protein [Rivularia sp. UHCC 0363]
MTNPLLSIIIPTHNRPQLVIRAVKSALEQTMEDLEVIVVDDASQVTPELPQDSRVRMIRLPQPSGGAAARNVGTKAACSRWITYLDDDDRLLPHMAKVSLKALSEKTKSPVAVISGLEVVDAQGKISHKRIPPKLRKQGNHFFLEELEPGYSYNTKQTLVVERKVIEQIGGWDETFRSRVHSELFLRLNPACSIIGLPVMTYQLTAHEGARVSRDVQLRQESFQRLIGKHKSLFKAHSQMFAHFVYDQAIMSQKLNQHSAAISNLLWAMQINPVYTCKRLARPTYYRIFKRFPVEYTL